MGNLIAAAGVVFFKKVAITCLEIVPNHARHLLFIVYNHGIS